MYRVEQIGSGKSIVEEFETAEDAMTAINRMSFVDLRRVVIRDETGAQITEQRLAMIVMEERFKAEKGG